MKKNVFFAALVAVACVFASCEKDPTAVLPENMDSKVTITGYVRIIKMKSDKKMDTTFVKNEDIQVLYGTDNGGSMAYRPYTATTDKSGFYTIELGCPLGQAIDEVKVVYSTYDKTYVVPKGKTDAVKTEAYFIGEKVKTNAAAGHAYNLDVFVKAESYTGVDENATL